MNESTTPTVQVDQIWQDNDPRMPDRYLRIVDIDTSHATVQQVAWNPEDRIAADLPGVRLTRIRLDRFRPTRTGYRYVGQVDE
ncbi:hypothetical protein [Streptomyces sp. S186]|uniref:hypothetical protein n=1 Tax=Streptomyces sp. S186 TaxID=3434395 RepID=UPI003F67A829